jgi:hypothetical protein
MITKIKLIGCLFLLFSFYMKGQDSEQLSIPLTYPNKPGTLKLGVINGSIKVKGYDGIEVLIDASSNDGEDGNGARTSRHQNRGRNDKGNGMKKISKSNGFGVSAEEKNNVIEAGVDNPNSDIDIVVSVPRNFSLQLSNVNGSDIIVENVNGNHEISNVNEGIVLKNVGGSVLANTINGDINVSFTTVTPDTPMAFTNLNGDIILTFPPSMKANVKAQTENGEIYSDFDLAMSNETSKKQVTKDTKKGMYKIVKDDWVKGSINGGGPEILLKTMNGDLFIKKGK